MTDQTSGTLALGQGAAIFGLEGPELLPHERDFFRDYDPFGFILFARNVVDPAQLCRLTADLREAVGRDAPVLIDQEGGRVQRLRAPHWREWLPPFEIVARIGDAARAAEVMELQARIIGHELRAAGIDANCAPLGDIARAETHAFLRNRCYGETADLVTAIAAAQGRGYLSAGVLPVLKHLPGHGRAVADSHLTLPRVSTPLPELIASDFIPFKALKDLPMAMTAHIIFDACDATRPATQSPGMIRLIREEIGFEGLLMTDDLTMEALQGEIGTRAAASLAAGCDIALHCKGDFQAMQAVADQAGRMSAAARARAARALSARIAAPEGDVMALEARLRALCPEALL